MPCHIAKPPRASRHGCEYPVVLIGPFSPFPKPTGHQSKADGYETLLVCSSSLKAKKQGPAWDDSLGLSLRNKPLSLLSHHFASSHSRFQTPHSTSDLNINAHVHDGALQHLLLQQRLLDDGQALSFLGDCLVRADGDSCALRRRSIRWT
jgi:hypothetical protein